MRVWILTAAAVLALMGSAAAQQPKEGKKPQQASGSGGGNPHAGKPNSDILRAYFKGYNRDNLPPGLAKKDRLPPGIRKQLVRDGTLPPGLDRDVQPLPKDVDSWLTRVDDGYRRGYVDGVVIEWNVKTLRIRSVVDLSF